LSSFHEFLKSRRSVRRFLPDPIPDKVIDRILETATHAPSAHNRQPWRFVVISTNQVKESLAVGMAAAFRADLLSFGSSEEEAEAQAAHSSERIMQTPVVILLCMDAAVLDVYPDERRQQAEHQMGIQSAALAGGQLLLAAHAEGLGGVWVCAPIFAPCVVRHALDLEDTLEPQALFLLGYPAKVPALRPRRPLAEVVRYM
jgi:coenzyme F420-0:L-glutamate ligase / coenzyme F420-1:gamma-L-glutamate ligase